MLLSLGDPSERVVSAVHQVFIPAFAAWTTELGTLHTALIPSLLSRIEKLLMVRACMLTFHTLVYIKYIYVCVHACHFRATDLGTMHAIICTTSHLLSSFLSSSFLPTVPPSFCSKQNMVWMNTSYTCSCQPYSLSSLLCLLWCYRMRPLPAEPNSMETYLQ